MPFGNPLSQNLALLHDVHLSDSSLSERRQSLGTEPWIQAMHAFLKQTSGEYPFKVF